MKALLESYRRGVEGRVAVHDNGLVWAAAPERALTWMNASCDGRPVTPRSGYQVEVNALWYNAVCYALELAARFGDTPFVARWQELPARIRASFLGTRGGSTWRFWAWPTMRTSGEPTHSSGPIWSLPAASTTRC